MLSKTIISAYRRESKFKEPFVMIIIVDQIIPKLMAMAGSGHRWFSAFWPPSSSFGEGSGGEEDCQELAPA